ncbi:hypothetical protein ACOAN1_29865, partial [Pseudomonas aeruginosa]
GFWRPWPGLLGLKRSVVDAHLLEEVAVFGAVADKFKDRVLIITMRHIAEDGLLRINICAVSLRCNGLGQMNVINRYIRLEVIRPCIFICVQKVNPEAFFMQFAISQEIVRAICVRLVIIQISVNFEVLDHLYCNCLIANTYILSKNTNKNN